MGQTTASEVLSPTLCAAPPFHRQMRTAGRRYHHGERENGTLWTSGANLKSLKNGICSSICVCPQYADCNSLDPLADSCFTCSRWKEGCASRLPPQIRPVNGMTSTLSATIFPYRVRVSLFHLERPIREQKKPLEQDLSNREQRDNQRQSTFLELEWHPLRTTLSSL